MQQSPYFQGKKSHMLPYLDNELSIGCCQNWGRNPKNININIIYIYIIYCLTCSQIWLNPLVADCHFWSNMRKFKKIQEKKTLLYLFDKIGGKKKKKNWLKKFIYFIFKFLFDKIKNKKPK